MVQIYVEYLGDLHCQVTHGPSGQTFLTDAPTDNQGKGEYISPTDMAATAVGSCILTIMGIVARNHQIDMDGTKLTVSKEMMNQPFRRIKRITLDFVFPKKLTEKEFKMLSAVIQTCPVTRSISPEVEIVANYKMPEE